MISSLSLALLALVGIQEPPPVWRLSIRGETTEGYFPLPGAVVRPWYELGRSAWPLPEVTAGPDGLVAVDLAALAPLDRARANLFAAVHKTDITAAKVRTSITDITASHCAALDRTATCATTSSSTSAANPMGS